MKHGTLTRILFIFIQLIVMLGDIFAVSFCAILLYLCPLNPFVWIIVILVFYVWYETGGFMAWHPKNIKMFLKRGE